MIFVGGIHGVGKSYFCNMIKEKLNINTYSASSLIEKYKQDIFSKDKLIVDIEGNQPYLIKAVEKLNTSQSLFLLEGHFCLLNANGDVKKIELRTFVELKPNVILLLIEEPLLIAERRQKRDGIICDIALIDTFQKQEILYSQEIADFLKIPIHIFNTSEIVGNIEDIQNILFYGRR